MYTGDKVTGIAWCNMNDEQKTAYVADCRAHEDALAEWHKNSPKEVEEYRKAERLKVVTEYHGWQFSRVKSAFFGMARRYGTVNGIRKDWQDLRRELLERYPLAKGSQDDTDNHSPDKMLWD